LASLLHRTRSSPERFNDVVLGRSPYWARQEELSRAVVDHRQVIIASGNAVGKSYWLAGIILWWLYTRPGALVISTAPTQTLLGSILWKELKRAHSSPDSLVRDLGIIHTDSPSVSPQRMTVPGLDSTAYGLATNEVERISGQHAGDLLVAVDEASGIEPEIWEGIDSLAFSRLVVIGNPLRPEGRFFDLFQQSRKEKEQGVDPRKRVWSTQISTLEGPHVDLETSPVGLAARDWLDDMRRRHGEDSLWWLTHIKAQFPERTHETIIPLEWIEAAYATTHDPRKPGGTPILTVDLGAGTGRDSTVLLVRDNLRVLSLEASSSVDPISAAKRAVELLRVHRIPSDRLVYDAAGLGRDFDRYLDRFGVQGATPYVGARSGRKRFGNLRSRCAWLLKLRLDPRRTLPKPAPTRDLFGRLIDHSAQFQPAFSIPTDQYRARLTEELVNLRGAEDTHGRFCLEPKDELAERLGRSPDLCDAFIMSFLFDELDDPAGEGA
jgi:hypothetical protein